MREYELSNWNDKVIQAFHGFMTIPKADMLQGLVISALKNLVILDMILKLVWQFAPIELSICYPKNIS